MRNRMGTKLFRIFLACVIAFSCTAFLGGWTSDYVDGSKQIMENLTVNVSLQENGDMKVNEIWKVDLKNRDKVYRNLYRTFQLDSSKADGVTDFSVYDEDQKIQYTFAGDIDPEDVGGNEYQNQCYIHNSSGQAELGWFMPEIEDGIRTFSINYTVKNTVHIYSDTSELYYQFLQNSFNFPITRMQGTITFPDGGEKSNLRTWLHTNVSDSNIQINSQKQISFMVNQIPRNSNVEVRLLMPTKLFPSAKRRSGEAAFSSIQAEENQQAERARAQLQAKAERQYYLGWIDAITAPIILVVCILLYVYARRKNKRIQVNVPEYTHDVPTNNSPAGIANLFYYYDGYAEKEKKRVFSATMLSLARKGYIKFENNNGEITTLISGNTKSIVLTQSEQVFYDLITEAASNYNNSFTMKQFKKYAEAHSKFVDQKFSDFFTVSKAEIANRGYYGKKAIFSGGFIVLGIFTMLLALVVFGVSGSADALMVYIPLSLIIGGILLVFAGKSKASLHEKGEYDYMVWHGLKKYMLEFSRMDEYGIPQLSLWEEYLVYATMMGISEEVCKQLKVVYPELSDSAYWDSNPYFSYLPFMGWSHRGFGAQDTSFDFGTALGNTIGDISSAATRLAHPPESSGSNIGGGGFGGGGFSGGGGGFGGGGGGVR